MAHPVPLGCLLAVALGLSCSQTARATNTTVSRGEASQSASALPSKREISFPSGALTLHGVVYLPSGAGPFPAVLWNHGAWGDPMVAFDRLAPTFTNAGWVFFGPFRRGQGLSSSAGPYIGDELDRAGAIGGQRARAAKMVALLTGDHLDDQLAADAWLKGQSYVIEQRIAVGGNSFGGIEAVLGAARVPYCAAIDGAGAAMSWAQAPELQDLMLRAARASRAPLLLFQAENDYDLAPSRALAAASSSAGKVAELKIYSAYGADRGLGHNFAWLGGDVWGPDVLSFLRQHCGK
jgi:dipeptidyl aminopeptidase/acylaminoacyl peptidase